jgi:hypothetical protein
VPMQELQEQLHPKGHEPHEDQEEQLHPKVRPMLQAEEAGFGGGASSRSSRTRVWCRLCSRGPRAELESPEFGGHLRGHTHSMRRAASSRQAGGRQQGGGSRAAKAGLS